MPSRVKTIAEISAYPLCWADSYARTKPQRRAGNYSWKGTFGVYRSHLLEEIRRLGGFDVIVSTDIPLTRMGLPREGFNPPDPGVAVYFKREIKPDTRWEDVLQFPEDWQIRYARDTALALADKQFRQLSRHCHTDGPRPDPDMFHYLAKSRDQAKIAISGKGGEVRDYAFAQDKFTEVRLNFHALGLTIEALRQIERCGDPAMLERSFRGFQLALTARASKAS